MSRLRHQDGLAHSEDCLGELAKVGMGNANVGLSSSLTAVDKCLF